MIYPVTPNGVEHQESVIVGPLSLCVIYPVTPNGVEHLYTAAQLSFLVGDLSGNA